MHEFSIFMFSICITIIIFKKTKTEHFGGFRASLAGHRLRQMEGIARITGEIPCLK